MTREISISGLQELRRNHESFALIQVLSPEEFQLHGIAGSMNAPVDGPDFLQQVWQQTGGDRHMCVVVYCAGPDCQASTRAANLLVDAGYTNVLEYRGRVGVWHSSPRSYVGHHGNGIASGERREASADLNPPQVEPQSGATPTSLERALQDPAAVFAQPVDVLADESLTQFEKLEVLQHWAHDADRLAVAESEGMGGGEQSKQSRVLRALEALVEQYSEDPRADHGAAPSGELLGRE